jgi:hypothetical protein
LAFDELDSIKKVGTDHSSSMFGTLVSNSLKSENPAELKRRMSRMRKTEKRNTVIQNEEMNLKKHMKIICDEIASILSQILDELKFEPIPDAEDFKKGFWSLLKK